MPSPEEAPVPLPDSQEAATSALLALREGSSTGPVNLRGANLISEDLAGRNLAHADLSGADLSRANLSGANLFGANLENATLFEADLSKAELAGANLTGANLDRANLCRTGLGMAKLSGASLRSADLSFATLTEADLVGADLSIAKLEQVRARQANLTGAHLADSDLTGIDFDGCTVEKTTFDRANLRASNIARLKGYQKASWIGVDLRDIDFTGAYLTRNFIMDQNFIAEFRDQSKWTGIAYHVWHITSDCGRSVLRWASFTLLVVLMFAMLYTTVDMDYGDYRTTLSPLYCSVVTLTTLGYGDVLPMSTAGQIVVMFEVVMGYVMLGGLLSIFSNKMATRAD